MNKLVDRAATGEQGTGEQAAVMAERDWLASRLLSAEAAALRDGAAREDERRQAARALEELRRQHATLLAHNHTALAELAATAERARLLLDAVYRSSSWRLSAPVRLVSRALRRAAVPEPAAPALPSLALPSPNLSSPTPPAVAPAPPQDPDTTAGAVPAAARHWFFLGDTLEWLRTHDQVTGVGRVTAELFFAALDQNGGHSVIPCVIAPGMTLAPAPLPETASLLAARIGGRPAPLLDGMAAASGAPCAGDHVLFTGVVWTAEYRALFQDLVRQQVHVSVLVYDVIPLEQTGFVSPTHLSMFRDWLETVLALATIVFVSSPGIGDQIRRWAALSCLPLAAAIVPIRFGAAVPPAAPDRAASPAAAAVRRDGFVLSVGTIDSRKNQASLVRIWAGLVAERGRAQVPQLVLVGRDDLNLAEAATLFEAGDVLVLQGLDDAAVAGLYRDCLLTVFPSLAEGYGLPVAESLVHGKLCLASDLAPVREHAGDLVWYFPPGDEAAAAALVRRAIDDGAARAAAEARIAAEYRPGSWSGTWHRMAGAVALLAIGHPIAPPPPENRPDVADVPRAAVLPALAAAQAWCSEDDPDVSILIVNWNASRLTRECLRQVWAHTTGRRYEVIIVDNGSTAEDLIWLQALGHGVRLLRLGINRYFGEANNIAAEAARGRYLCLLNNDAFVTPGWLPPLVDELEHDASAGAAGPLFLFPGGLIQEAGATIGADGIPIRFGRGMAEDAVAPEVLAAKDVDYISAAALLVRRDLFMAAGGFDLVYEPAYYEDVDLCFRLRALGHAVRFCPAARVVHVEGSAANDDPDAEARRNALGNLNRGKFLARWGGSPVRSEPPPARVRRAAAASNTALLFTPYPLALGGGERYLLTLASVLASDHVVTIATAHPYSALRLLNLGRELRLDLSECRLVTAPDLSAAPDADLTVVLGNHVLPPVPARSANTSYICQFPFPVHDEAVRAALPGIGPYRRVIVYSDYARAHVLAGLSAHQMPPWPIEVVAPAAPQHGGDPGRKSRMILSVGRFFAGGHSKRHDLMIAAFRRLLKQSDTPMELHLAGASMPGGEHMDHLGELMAMATDLPVRFHVNAAPETLDRLYAGAAVYWHAAGLGAALSQVPQDAEHFGISVVEAMSAGCVPVAFNAGGPREIITSGVDGYLYGRVEELIGITGRLLSDDRLREAVGGAAMRRAANFSEARFASRIRAVLLDQPDGR